MATYLSLCQDLARECDLGSTPGAVTGNVGELANVVRWIADAYMDIQNRHGGRWRWLRHEFTLSTTASDDTYTYGDCTDVTSASAITRFKAWRLNDRFDPPKIYLTSAGAGTQTWMIWTPWESFKTIYKIGTQNDGYPVHITVDPQDQIVIGPSPNDAYTIQGDFYRSPQVLAADADEPEMPSHFHNLIWRYALENYGFQQLANEVLARHERQMRRTMRQLEAEQLPKLRKAGALA